MRLCENLNFDESTEACLVSSTIDINKTAIGIRIYTRLQNKFKPFCQTFRNFEIRKSVPKRKSEDTR